MLTLYINERSEQVADTKYVFTDAWENPPLWKGFYFTPIMLQNQLFKSAVK